VAQFETIPFLIQKRDNFEIIRDHIAGIIFCNQQEQQSLAANAGEDSALWKLDVFTEAASPFEKWLNLDSGEVSQTDEAPIINVWFENATYPEDKGNVIKKQHSIGVFNIDIYGLGFAEDDGNGGHISADKAAAFNSQRALKLIRNILMAAQNTYLQLRGVVGQRWIQSVSSFQPRLGEVPVQNILGIRIAFRVLFIEESPQESGETLDELAITLNVDNNGQVTEAANVEYIYS